MPVAIADYTQFNMLSIFAPELRGRWNMVPVPGFEQVDPETGEVFIDATVPITVGGAIMMENSRLKDSSWEFLKWWTDWEAQFNFGRQLEAVMGAAARWNTANMEAFERMPWTAEVRQNLAVQIGLMGDNVPERFVVEGVETRFRLKGIPEVPGGYYTTRQFDFARNDVLNDDVQERQDPRQRLLRAVIYINNEITRRREEFNMTLTEEEWRARNN
jgi:ABC-type glycerol-3-phosphate transport system substrate-binding protein